MGEQVKHVGMQTLKFLPEECIPEAVEVLEYRRLVYDVIGRPSVMQGYYLQPCFEEEAAMYAYNNVNLKKGDILIASYPKTGTTWMRAVVQHILHGKNPEDLEKFSALRHFLHYFEFGPASKYKIWEKLSFPQQVFATHLPAPLVNLKKYRENGAKVICTIRNPKDQMVSWRNFIMSFPHSKMDHWKDLMPENENEFYDLYIAGKQKAFAKEGEGYLNCLREWYEYKDDKNFYFVVFEKMKKDPKREIKMLAEFIGHPLTEEELNDVVEKTSFQAMKSRKEKKRSDSLADITRFRKGKVGDWRNHLTVAQSELVDRKVEEILGDTDIKFIYQ